MTLLLLASGSALASTSATDGVPSTPILTLTTSPNPSEPLVALDVNVSMSDAAAPSGDVVVCQDASTVDASCTGGTVLCTIPAWSLPSGCYPSFPPGQYDLTAFYAGDANNDAATSNTVALVVTKAQPTLVISSMDNPSTFGSTMIDAFLGDAISPTGNITFCVGATTVDEACTGGTILCTSTADAGFCPASAALPAGSHDIGAYYPGDANNEPVTATPITQVVNRAEGFLEFDALVFEYDGSTHAVTAHIWEEPASTCTADQSPIGPDVGTYPVTATCIGTNYQATSDPWAEATINKGTGTVAFDQLDFVYDGTQKVITAHISEEPGTSCQVSNGTIGPNAGTYTNIFAYCEGTNYNAGDVATATIAKAEGTLVFDRLTFVYETDALHWAEAHIAEEPVFCYAVAPVGPDIGIHPVSFNCSGTNYTATRSANAVIDLIYGQVDVTAMPITARIGDPVSFVITVTNNGDVDPLGAPLFSLINEGLESPTMVCLQAESTGICPPPESILWNGVDLFETYWDTTPGSLTTFVLSGFVGSTAGPTLEHYQPIWFSPPYAAYQVGSDPADLADSAAIVVLGETVFVDGFEGVPPVD